MNTRSHPKPSHFQEKRVARPGFTLIELLVVVAIIALLAATILASLGGARKKAREARATSELSSMRAQAELYYNNHGFSYGGGAAATSATDCIAQTQSLFGDSSSDSLVKLISDVGGIANNDVACKTDGKTWAVAATLSNGIFCVDSNGTSKMLDSATNGNLGYGGAQAAFSSSGANACQE